MDSDALAVPHSRGCIRRVRIVVVHSERRHIPGALFDHLGDLRIGDLKTVFNGVTAAIQRSLQTQPVVGVAGNLLPPSVRLVNDSLELLHGQRGL